MKYMKIAVVTLILVLLVASVSNAGLRKPGINGAAFLKIGVGARNVALGSAVTTLAGDPSMIFWNPAGISTPGGTMQVSLDYNDWIVGLNHNAGAASYTIENIGTIGIGIVYMGLSDLEADRDIAPTGFESEQIEPAGTSRFDTYDYGDMLVTFGYAKQFTDKFRMGFSAKYIRQSLDGESSSAFAADFGAIYNTGFRDFTLGARLNNVGTDMSYYAYNDPLPLNFSIGASGSLAEMENANVKGYFDFTKPMDSPQLYFVGGEWNIMDVISVRTGYKIGYSGSLDEYSRLEQTDEGATFGAGLKLKVMEHKLWVDYAYTNFSVFDDTHRFSLRFEM